MAKAIKFTKRCTEPGTTTYFSMRIFAWEEGQEDNSQRKDNG